MSFEIPENIEGLSLDELKTLLDTARAAGLALVESDDVSAEDIKQAQAIMEFMEQVEETISTQEAAVAEAEKTLADARAKFATPENSEGDDEGNDEGDDEGSDDEPEGEPEDTVEQEPAAVVAAADAASKVAKRAPKPTIPAKEKNVSVIIASADVPGFATGSAMEDLNQVAKGVIARWNAMPTTRIGGKEGVMNRYGVAQFNLADAREDGLYQGNPDFADDQELLMAASKESRLSGNSLTAAGGWCSPSETLYDFCVEESTDGILDLPSITVNRGGLRYTKGPDFAAIYADTDLGWWLTEAQVIAEASKPCIDVECPPFTDTRLDAIGICIRAGLLTRAAYPELVRRYIEATLIAHQHKVAAGFYTRISNAATARTMDGAETTTDSLGILEIGAEYERQRKRMAFNTTLEVLLPVWYKAVIRADLARRNGVEAWNVTDAQIQSYFANRKLRPQWLYNTGQDLVLATAEIQVPATVSAVMYPAGAFVKGTTDIITLDAVYDSTLLAKNTFTALWAEEGAALYNPCGDAIKLTIPTCASGETGAATIASCLGQNAPTPPEEG